MANQTASGLPFADETGSTEKKNVSSDNEIQNGDVETCVANFDEVHTVKQGLHQRHIQMIALAGTSTHLFQAEFPFLDSFWSCEV